MKKLFRRLCNSITFKYVHSLNGIGENMRSLSIFVTATPSSWKQNKRQESDRDN